MMAVLTPEGNGIARRIVASDSKNSVNRGQHKIAPRHGDDRCHAPGLDGGLRSRNRLTRFNRAGAETSYAYDANSNRLTAIDKITSDIDLDGDYDNADFSKTTSQNLTIEGTSNRLLGLTQTLTNVRGTRTVSTVNSNVAYAVDAAGNLTSDGLRTFEYDASNRLSKARIFKDGEEASIRYLHNAVGQRVFKGEPTASQTLPSERTWERASSIG